MARTPKINLKSIVDCLHKPIEDAYIETNNNSTNPPGDGATTLPATTLPATSVSGSHGSSSSTSSASHSSGSTKPNAATSKLPNFMSDKVTTIGLILLGLTSATLFGAAPVV
jgi:hypothetical protein